MKLISACLAGVPCRFDGGTKEKEGAKRLVAEGRALPVCPEQLGGLATPRSPAEIEEGDGTGVVAGAARVIDATGEDRTEAFLRGARETLRLARLVGADGAILKERSPSCGRHALHRSGAVVAGSGVTAALLEAEGIPVVSDEEVCL